MRRHVLLTAGMLAAAAAPAAAELVVEWWGNGPRCRHNLMTVELSKYGKKGLVNPKMANRAICGIHALRFDLSPIPKGAEIHHASLRVHAPLEAIRTDKRAYMSIGRGHWYHDPLRLYAETPPWKPAEIYAAGEGSAAGKPVYDKSRPLVLEPPQYKSFDATAAVRDWVSGKRANLGFVVRQLDLWDWVPRLTVLEVRYEGKLTDPPSKQARDVKVVHRKGQTFITWTEIEKIIDKEVIRWKEFEDVFKEHSPRGSVFYRLYRSDRPITSKNLARATLVDEIWPLSGHDGRVHEHMTRGEDWMGLNPEVEVPRYCIVPPPPTGPLPRDGKRRKANSMEWWNVELPLHTGLYVHQPRKAGKAHYAVTVLQNGVENTRAVSPANSLAEPVAEVVAPGEPILYRWLDQTSGTGRRQQLRETQFFVYWAAPPYANQPRRPIHIMVGLNGANPSEKMSVRYTVGDMYGSEINRGTHVHQWRDYGIVFSLICDGCFGSAHYWSSWNTLLSKEQAKREPYGKRMVDLFTPWVRKLPRRGQPAGK